MASILEVQRANHEDIERARREIITLLTGKCVTVSCEILITNERARAQERQRVILVGLMDEFNYVLP